METYHIIPYPLQFPPADASGYFWFFLPYALSGFFTLISAYIIAGFSIYKSFSGDKNTRWLSFYLAVTFIGYGTTGLLMAFRSVMMDETQLLSWSNYLAPLATFITQGTSGITYYWTNRRFRFMKLYILTGWIISVIVTIGSVAGILYVPFFHVTQFGKFPQALLILKIWIIFTFVVGYTSIPLILFYYRHQKIKLLKTSEILINAGIILLILLISFNALLLMGVKVFPLGNFAFIPIAMMAYGLFISDFMGLNDFLFRKNGLFYLINFLLSVIFLVIAFGIIYGVNPNFFETASNLNGILVRIFTAWFIFMIAIFIAALNPGSKMHQYLSLTIILYGFFQLILIADETVRSPLVFRRIEMVSFALFSFCPLTSYKSIQYFFNFKTPKWIYLFYSLCVLSALLSFTDFFVKGYYNYPFGIISSASIGLVLLAVIGVILLVILLFSWLKYRTAKVSQDVMVVGLLLATIYPYLYLPLVLGYPYKIMITHQLVPVLIIGLATLINPGYGFSYAGIFVTKRIFIAFGLMILIFTIILSAPVKGLPGFIYLMLIIAPLSLFTLLMGFSITRPVTDTIEENINQLNVKNIELEKQKKEIVEKNDQITSSLEYASTIQDTLLPGTEYLDRVLNKYFILYLPRDIVSGDFTGLKNQAIAL